jgi:hypothetical protein
MEGLQTPISLDMGRVSDTKVRQVSQHGTWISQPTGKNPSANGTTFQRTRSHSTL